MTLTFTISYRPRVSGPDGHAGFSVVELGDVLVGAIEYPPGESLVIALDMPEIERLVTLSARSRDKIEALLQKAETERWTATGIQRQLNKIVQNTKR